jgi:hypothetical protein
MLWFFRRWAGGALFFFEKKHPIIFFFLGGGLYLHYPLCHTVNGDRNIKHAPLAERSTLMSPAPGASPATSCQLTKENFYGAYRAAKSCIAKASFYSKNQYSKACSSSAARLAKVSSFINQYKQMP